MSDYGEYLETLKVVRRRAQLLNAALGDSAPGMFVHSIAMSLMNALIDLHSAWRDEYAERVPRVEGDPFTEEFLTMLTERNETPDTIPPEWVD
jgi:hypothetical protein